MNDKLISTAARRAPGRAWLRRAGMLALLVTLAAPALAQDQGEIEFWKSVQNSKNPAELQAYLDTYPNGRFTALARLRITQLGGKPGTAPAPTAQTPPPSTAMPAPPARAEAPPVREAPAPAPEHAATLGAAIRAGDMTAVQAAVAGGADVNALDERGMPPIGLAALLGKPDIIAYLAANGADVSRNDRFGFTPLMNAAIRGQPEAARVLLALGADPTLKGGNGNDPLGAARPNGPADRRYEGKVAVTKMLEAAIAARSNGAATPKREGRAQESGEAPQQHAANSGAALPPVGLDSLKFPADQPEVSTEAYLQDVAKTVRESTKLACDAPTFYHWKITDWDQPRFQRNTRGVLTSFVDRGYRVTELKSPLDNLRIVRVDNAAPAPASPALLLAFYLEEQTDYYLMACSAGK